MHIPYAPNPRAGRTPPVADLALFTRPQLAALGVGSAAIDRMLLSGELVRVCRGLYGTEQTPAVVVRALRAGQILTCVTALSLQGFWQLEDRSLQVAQRRAGTRSGAARRRPGVILHDPSPRRASMRDVFAPILMCLEHLVRCRGVEDAAIVIESGLNRGLITGGDVQELKGMLPHRTAVALGDLRSDADAGTETRTRRFFERRGVQVRSQVQFLQGRWRADLLVGDRLVVECDSRLHHTGVEEYSRTYRKRLDLQALGMVYVQLTYAQVMHDWERTMRHLGWMLDRGEHRGRRGWGRGAELEGA